MPFITTIRRNHEANPQAESAYEITGGNYVVTAGGYKIHFFTSIGEHELTIKSKFASSNQNVLHMARPAPPGPVAAPITLETLVIGGGAGGWPEGPTAWGGGGGGAGGFRTTPFSVGPTNIGTLPVNVGGGGGAASNGGNSNFSTVTATGGGTSRNNGGSGGGAWAGDPNGHGNNSVTGEGNPGGWAHPQHAGGGGGGAGGGGGGSFRSYTGGAGGPGLSSSISGSPVTYSGGGAGGCHGDGDWPGSQSGGAPGGGGRGAVYNNGWGGFGGQTNLGGGGGGGTRWGFPGYNGGPGIVIVRYPS